ncbi:hypothetical protein PR202_ga17722 [Eleusine coracana subsp. coracana]|uniref:Uncharacterized protein n=1 Tax=Eleusine coracana subsp. coracana TaxID=191504 RepID=A0AAV5CQD6_ELECO|nr:hypothetical protein PR202_ga17475 [Eleusine coracana subsp. coracana]GJN00533.1 hypothetical protein PR202_ga17722 [Eleusine coracana subsp. coracana]
MFGGTIFALVYCTAGFDATELSSWSFHRAGVAEFTATVMGVNRFPSKCATAHCRIQSMAWAFGVSGGYINSAVTLGLFLARKLSLPRALCYAVMHCPGTIRGAGVVKTLVGSPTYGLHQGRRARGRDRVHLPSGVRGERGSATLCAGLPCIYPVAYTAAHGFAVFLVHLATILITGTGINRARSLSAAIIYDRARTHGWHNHVRFKVCDVSEYVVLVIQK